MGRAGRRVAIAQVEGGQLGNEPCEEAVVVIGDAMGAGEALVGRGVADRRQGLAVLVHSRGAVGVELAERHGAVVLVEEGVDAGDGHERLVAAGQHDEPLVALVEVEQGPVVPVAAVGVDHLDEDPVHGLGHGLHRPAAAFVQQLREKRRVQHVSAHHRRGSFHIVACRAHLLGALRPIGH